MIIEILKTLFLVFWEIVKLSFNTVLSIFPIYQQLSSFRQDLLAALIGVPSFLITVFAVLFKIIKRVRNQ